MHKKTIVTSFGFFYAVPLKLHKSLIAHAVSSIGIPDKYVFLTVIY